MPPAWISARHSFEFLVNSHGLPSLDPSESARLAPVLHPLVRQLPDGRRSLYLSPPYMDTIDGMEPAESRVLIQELTDWATAVTCFAPAESAALGYQTVAYPSARMLTR